MIIDDEQDILDIFQDLFRLWGYSLQTYKCPKKALQDIRENPEKYQIVLADVRMDGVDGIDLALEIHSINKEIKIIFATGYDVHNDIQERLDALPIPGILLRKPFGMDKLRTVLESLPRASSSIRDEPGQ